MKKKISNLLIALMVITSFFVYAPNSNAQISLNSYTSVTTNQAASSTTPQIISFDQVYSGTISDVNDIDLYVINQSYGGKITAYMQVPQNSGIDYNISLFKQDESTGDLKFVAGCDYPEMSNEIFSYISDSGVYIVAIGLKKLETSPEPYQFILMNSLSYSSNEPNDNLYQIKEYKFGEEYKDTIDNPLDEDYYHFTIPENGKYKLNINNPSANVNLRAVVQDSNLAVKSDTNTNGTFEIELEKGFHIIRFFAEQGFDPNTEYSFTLQNANAVEKKQPVRAVITKIVSDQGANGSTVPYPEGRKWRVKGGFTAYGVLYDKDGNPVPNEHIFIGTNTKLSDKSHIGEGDTNENGEFIIKVSNLDPARGDYMYDTGVSYHYYDIISFVVLTPDATVLDCNIYDLYHFAYSIYHKF